MKKKLYFQIIQDLIYLSILGNFNGAYHLISQLRQSGKPTHR